jgi:hypothetical protein
MQRKLCLPVEKQLCFTIRVILLLSTVSLCVEHSATDSTSHIPQAVSYLITAIPVLLAETTLAAIDADKAH